MGESSCLHCVLIPHGSSQTLIPRWNGAIAETKCCHQVRGIGSKGAVLVIVWTFLVAASVMSVVVPVLYFNILTDFQITVPYGLLLAFVLGIGAVVLIISPTAGLLASICFGRYSTLNTGLWLMWAGSVFACALLILQWFFPEAQQMFFACGLVIAALVFSVGFVLFIVNAVPFGLDQMPDASGEQITAFIFWYTWSFLAGIVSIALLRGVITCCIYHSSRRSLLLSLLAVTLTSLTLCSKFLLRGWLIIEPKGLNPLKTFCGILRFAAKHKIPIRRSAFTYWEEEKPSRLDLAKTKYGGPYSHEEVENVKTFLRMVVVIASIIVMMLAFYSYHLSALSAFEAEFTSNHNIYSTLVFSAGSLAVVLGFPIYEMLIRPYIKKWIPSILRRVGWSQTISIIASFLLLVTTTVWYMHSNPTKCMFTSDGSSPFQVDPNWIEIPYNILICSFIFFAHTALLEFVCAQAPYILRGLLVGLGYSVALSSSALGVGIFIAWRVSYQEKAPNSPSCGVWFYLFTTITATLGCVLWCAVAKWYKRREREEPDMCRIFAENYYDH